MANLVDTIPAHNVETALRIKQLEKQLAWYRSFFENAADAVLVVQPETWCILDANPQAASLLGITHHDLIGSTIPPFRRIFKLLTRSASPTVLSELSVDTPAGNVMMEVSARFVTYDNQQLIQAIARDVSEQRALTDKLVQADKLVLLGQLSAGVAHEIRNPLAAINLNLQMLQRKTSAESAQQNYIAAALQGVERISKIVEATLSFSRSAPPVTKTEQINNIIVSSLDLSAPSLRRKTVSVTLDLSEQLPSVQIDASQIQQVFINLITNAADAIKAKGRIEISTYEEPTARGDGRYVVASIRDSGVGIKPDDLSKIFNPFFTKKSDGTGLGLPISQRIIHQHNGAIEVESVPNEGTTFYIKLPVVSADSRRTAH